MPRLVAAPTSQHERGTAAHGSPSDEQHRCEFGPGQWQRDTAAAADCGATDLRGGSDGDRTARWALAGVAVAGFLRGCTRRKKDDTCHSGGRKSSEPHSASLIERLGCTGGAVVDRTYSRHIAVVNR
jgi:hypothetical protein